jgi:hypothetical protein
MLLFSSPLMEDKLAHGKKWKNCNHVQVFVFGQTSNSGLSTAKLSPILPPCPTNYPQPSKPIHQTFVGSFIQEPSDNLFPGSLSCFTYWQTHPIRFSWYNGHFLAAIALRFPVQTRNRPSSWIALCQFCRFHPSWSRFTEWYVISV